MDSDALIELALEKLGCTQQTLAKRLGVSPTQVSKWKGNGTEHMSSEMEKKIKALAGLDEGADAGFIRRAGGATEAEKWERLIHYLAELAEAGSETGYDTDPLTCVGQLTWLPGQTLELLHKLGVKIPRPFPKKWDFDYGKASERKIETLLEEPLVELISAGFKALTNLYGFHAAFVSGLMNDPALEDEYEDAIEIEDRLLDLAFCKAEFDTEFDRSLTPNFKKFNYETLKDYRTMLATLKERAMRAGIPLKAELLNLVYDSADDCGQQADAESMGFNDDRLHPDIYMNELLVSSRLIHQVLPKILEKLDIKFTVDDSDLTLMSPEDEAHIAAARATETKELHSPKPLSLSVGETQDQSAPTPTEDQPS